MRCAVGHGLPPPSSTTTTTTNHLPTCPEWNMGRFPCSSRTTSNVSYGVLLKSTNLELRQGRVWVRMILSIVGFFSFFSVFITQRQGSNTLSPRCKSADSEPKNLIGQNSVVGTPWPWQGTWCTHPRCLETSTRFLHTHGAIHTVLFLLWTSSMHNDEVGP